MHCGVATATPTIPDPELPFHNIEMLEDIALEDENLATTQDEADAIVANHQLLFDMLQNDPNLLESSEILQDFLLNNQLGTLDYPGLTSYALDRVCTLLLKHY